jgi:hypothetical protein
VDEKEQKRRKKMQHAQFARYRQQDSGHSRQQQQSLSCLCSAPPAVSPFSPYLCLSVYQVLKDVHPDMGMTRRGMLIMENFVKVGEQQQQHTA